MEPARSDSAPTQLPKKGDPELARLMRKFIFWGAVKLLVLSAITAVVLYFYL